MAGTLVIIDMQIGFSAHCCKSTVKACCREVKQAKKRGDGIIVVQFGGYGFTVEPIIKAIGDYPADFVTKSQDDGSKEVLESLQELPQDYLRVCGINASACVRSTILGIKSHFTKEIVAVADAINHIEYSHPWHEWSMDSYFHRQHLLDAIRRYGVTIDNKERLLPA